MPVRPHLPSLVICLWLLLYCATAQSRSDYKPEAWDDGYRRFQDYAPEYIEIRVSHVETKENNGWFGGNQTRVVIQGQVEHVFRSKSGLHQGDNIFIQFTRQASAGSADLTPQIPPENKVIPAFLRKSGQGYEIAAYHHSFSPLTARQLEELEKNLLEKQTSNATTRKSEDEARAKKMVELIEGAKKAEAEASSRKEAARRSDGGIPQKQESAAAVIQTLPETSETMAPAPPAPEPPTAKPTPAPPSSAPASGIEMEPLPKKSEVPSREAIAVREPSPSTPDIPPAVPSTPQKSEAMAESNTTATVIPAESESSTPRRKINYSSKSRLTLEPITTGPRKDTSESLPQSATASMTTIVEPPVAAVAAVNPPPRKAPPTAPVTDAEPIKITEITPQAPAAEPAVVTPAKTEPITSEPKVNKEGVESYAVIYGLMKDADAAAIKNNFKTSRETYVKALNLLTQLQEKQPDFQPFIVEFRLKDLQSKIENLDKKIAELPPAPAPAKP